MHMHTNKTQTHKNAMHTQKKLICDLHQNIPKFARLVIRNLNYFSHLRQPRGHQIGCSLALKNLGEGGKGAECVSECVSACH